MFGKHCCECPVLSQRTASVHRVDEHPLAIRCCPIGKREWMSGVNSLIPNPWHVADWRLKCWKVVRFKSIFERLAIFIGNSSSALTSLTLMVWLWQFNFSKVPKLLNLNLFFTSLLFSFISVISRFTVRTSPSSSNSGSDEFVLKVFYQKTVFFFNRILPH